MSFSGGIDSSAVLAVAVDIARVEGPAAPVPITYRFHDAPAADPIADHLCRRTASA